MSTDFGLGMLVFTVHLNDFRSYKIKRIVIDDSGTNYILTVDGVNVEKSAKEIDKTKEGLFNKMVDRFTSRSNK